MTTPRRKFRKLSDGEWSNRSKKRKATGNYVQAIRCCDCGLAHIIEYQITNDRLRFRAWRVPRRKPEWLKP